MARVAKASLIAGLVIALGAATAQAQSIASSVNPAKLPKYKRTKLGLYVTSKDAHAALNKNPKILFLDVRSRAEFSFVGHPKQIDRNIPFQTLSASYSLDTKRKQYKMVPNNDFRTALEQARKEQGLTKSDPVFLICRSGSRSRGASDYMAKLGYTRVYNVVDGFEGDKDKSGHRTLNGWKNAKLPWTYALTKAKAYAAPAK